MEEVIHEEDSQKIKKKTKTPRITDEGWNSRNGCLTQWSRRCKKMKGGEKDERKEKTHVSSSKALFRFTSTIGFFTE